MFRVANRRTVVLAGAVGLVTLVGLAVLLNVTQSSTASRSLSYRKSSRASGGYSYGSGTSDPDGTQNLAGGPQEVTTVAQAEEKLGFKLSMPAADGFAPVKILIGTQQYDRFGQVFFSNSASLIERLVEGPDKPVTRVEEFSLSEERAVYQDVTVAGKQGIAREWGVRNVGWDEKAAVPALVDWVDGDKRFSLVGDKDGKIGMADLLRAAGTMTSQ